MAFVAMVAGVFLCNSSAQGQGWPEIFNPSQLMTLNMEIDPDDWQAVLNTHPGDGGPAPDCIYDPPKVPAYFWMDGEETQKIRVEVRRKKGFAFPNESNPQKVALKIDINEYYQI